MPTRRPADPAAPPPRTVLEPPRQTRLAEALRANLARRKAQAAARRRVGAETDQPRQDKD